MPGLVPKIVTNEAQIACRLFPAIPQGARERAGAEGLDFPTVFEIDLQVVGRYDATGSTVCMTWALPASIDPMAESLTRMEFNARQAEQLVEMLGAIVRKLNAL